MGVSVGYWVLIRCSWSVHIKQEPDLPGFISPSDKAPLCGGYLLSHFAQYHRRDEA